MKETLKKYFGYFGEYYAKDNCGMCDVCVPPYVVFPDTALKQMAIRYPRTLESFRRISRVGDIKLNKYGERFVEKIKSYCKDNGISRTDNEDAKKAAQI